VRTFDFQVFGHLLMILGGAGVFAKIRPKEGLKSIT
jgi:hypothetical protein